MPPKKYYRRGGVAAVPPASAVIDAHKAAVARICAGSAASASPLKCDHTLVLVESPSKCAKIEGFLKRNLEGEYKVLATKGHLYEIDGLRSIDTKKTFIPKYQISAHQNETVKLLRQQISIANKVILATDGDREGETIAYHICLIFDLDPATTERIIFNEITETAIIHAVQHPALINMDLVRAQQARCVLDILVGYKLSPLLWRYIGNGGNENITLSAGRCQTPALRLVYENHLERLATLDTKIETNYKIHAYFFAQNFPFELCGGDDYPAAEDEVRTFLQESKTHPHIFLTAESSKIKKSVANPPAPLNTSAIIQLCSNHMHISPKDTMRLCQSLYQSGHITYMRTDSRKYADTFIHSTKNYIRRHYASGASLLADDYERITSVAAAVGAGESHEAIRPTHIETAVLPDDIEPRQKALYKLIRNHTLESCMCPAVSETREIYISAPRKLRYMFMAQRPIVLGWKTVVAVTSAAPPAAAAAAQFSFFDAVVKNTAIPYNSIDAMVTMNSKHSHYTEAALVKKMEELGIGRPSTFSALVDTIIKRGYVKKTDVEGITIECREFRLERGAAAATATTAATETVIKKEFSREKNKLVIQNVGIATIVFLLKYFDGLFSFGYTSKMEERLDVIAHGNEVWNHICKECYDEIKNLIKPVTNISKNTYMLDEQHELFFSAIKGPLIKYTANPQTPEDIVIKSVKSGMAIDMVRLGEGGYTLGDLLELQNNCLGVYEGEPMYIHKGKFGVYVQWGEHKESIKNINKVIDQITLADVDAYLRTPTKDQLGKNVIRVISRDLSIRKSKYGAYIYYKTDSMKEPKFFSIKKDFKTKYMNSDEETICAYCGIAVAAPAEAEDGGGEV
jgi:DNA topoisomerase-1